jgi:aspartate carbamoyltransferase regulatory subunit
VRSTSLDSLSKQSPFCLVNSNKEFLIGFKSSASVFCRSSRLKLVLSSCPNFDCITNREHGASIEVKLSDDIYMLFHYLEGTYTIADLKPLLSRSRRNTNTQNDNEDSNIHDI